MKKVFQARAEIIQAWFAVRGVRKAILGTFAMAGKPHITIQAKLGKGLAFICSKFQLLLRGDQIKHVLFLDIAQEVVRFHKMIAGVQIAIMLHGES